MTIADNTDLLIFGAKGDLAARKLFPALYHLESCKLLPKDLRIITLARRPIATEAFLEALQQKIKTFIVEAHWQADTWQTFRERFSYIKLDFSQAEDYASLAQHLNEARTSIFYLATPPSLFGTICKNLGSGGCLQGESRIVLEKPIGHDLQSSREVNEVVGQYFKEEDIYRIDHYLGKETVQNLLVMRFANRFINTQWDQGCVDHVQITVAETVGIEGRWAYYDQVGQLRDMVQNHLMQLLCLVAMEPPNAMDRREHTR